MTTLRLPSVGFIGLGVMGRPMTTHLARAGCTMHLFDARPGLAEELAEQGYAITGVEGYLR